MTNSVIHLSKFIAGTVSILPTLLCSPRTQQIMHREGEKRAKFKNPATWGMFDQANEERVRKNDHISINGLFKIIHWHLLTGVQLREHSNPSMENY